MGKNKPKWEDLPFEERIEKKLKQAGLSTKRTAEWKETYIKHHIEGNEHDFM